MHITERHAHEKSATDLVQILGPKNIGLDTKFAYLSWTDQKILKRIGISVEISGHFENMQIKKNAQG